MHLVFDTAAELTAKLVTRKDEKPARLATRIEKDDQSSKTQDCLDKVNQILKSSTERETSNEMDIFWRRWLKSLLRSVVSKIPWIK